MWAEDTHAIAELPVRLGTPLQLVVDLRSILGERDAEAVERGLRCDGEDPVEAGFERLT